MVELQGGKIGAQNNEGAGATFFFELPLNLTENTAPETSRPYLNELLTGLENYSGTTVKSHFDTRYASLLIIEDNAELLHFLKETLCSCFASIYIASNGKEALKIMEKHLPDIIVSDVMMPVMNGYELCKYVKENLDYSHIPVILLTARNEEQSQQLGYKLGADAFLPKPFEIDTLLEILRNKLKQRDEIKKRYAQTALLPEPMNATFSMADENFLLKLNKIIDEHLNNPELGVPFICQEMGFSRTSLYNKLKAITGMGLNDYINKIKMEKAISLVKTTNLSFAEIADQIGFSTARYFSTTFKQYTGQTPTQYREEWLASHKEKNKHHE